MGHGEHHHAEGQRQHGEVDLVEPHAEEADDGGEQPAEERRRNQRDGERNLEMQQQQGGRVRPDPEEGGVAERQHAGVTEDQIEARREQTQDQDLGSDEHVEVRGVIRQKREPEDQHGDDRRDGQDLRPHGAARPMSPCGLSSRTRAMPR